MTEIICVVLLFVVIGLGLYLGARAGRRIRNLELLFFDSLEEMENAYEIFFNLTKRSTLLTDHPDIKNLEQVMLLVLNILERYLKDGKQITADAPQQEKRDE